MLHSRIVAGLFALALVASGEPALAATASPAPVTPLSLPSGAGPFSAVVLVGDPLEGLGPKLVAAGVALTGKEDGGSAGTGCGFPALSSFTGFPS